jgi:hypothetical protein
VEGSEVVAEREKHREAEEVEREYAKEPACEEGLESTVTGLGV